LRSAAAIATNCQAQVRGADLRCLLFDHRPRNVKLIDREFQFGIAGFLSLRNLVRNRDQERQ
jgi:hypothetical protein